MGPGLLETLEAVGRGVVSPRLGRLGGPPARELTTCFSVCRSYGELADCTRSVIEALGCYWPSKEVDKFFVTVHQHYFRSCPIWGRAERDPPSSTLCLFIVPPTLATLLVTVLVVWRSKRGEGLV